MSDYADQRYYAVGMGRFNVPDPSGSRSANSGNPTSWNRYAYTYGDPVNMVDVTGGATCLIYGDPYFCSDGGAGSGGGDNQGMEIDHSGETKEDKGTEGPIYRPECDRTNPANAKKLDWIKAHRGDATKVAGELGVTPAEILGLSALESSWGQSRFAKDGNSFFGMQCGSSLQIGCMPALKNPKVKEAKYNSYADSAESFRLDDGYLVQGLKDPSAFASALQDAGKYGIDTTTGKPVGGYVGDVAGTINGLALRMDCDK